MLLWGRKNKDIDLVLSSSGTRAPCFIGALQGLEEKQYNIRRIAGSSGGAIIAAAYALGMSLPDMKKISEDIPYDKMRDFRIKNLLSLSNPSVFTGRELDAFYQSIFKDAVLKDFVIDCKIAVVTIIGRNRIILDKQSYPDLPVWKAVRMSSTIPFIFPYYTLGDEPITDGGLVTNMFDIFPDSPRAVLGVRPRADYGLKKIIQDVKVSKLFIWNYLKIIAEYFLDAADSQHIPEVEWNRTIIIPTLKIGGFNFHLNESDVEQLIQNGYEAVTTSTLTLS